MFGCYRRGDANDPETYVAAVAMVLARYSLAVIKAVTDPYSGLPGRKNADGWSGLPDVADVKEACEAEASRAERMARYAAMPRFARLEPPSRRPLVDPAPGEDGKHPAGTILTNFDEATKRYGRPIGAFEDGRVKPHAAR